MLTAREMTWSKYIKQWNAGKKMTITQLATRQKLVVLIFLGFDHFPIIDGGGK